MAQKCAEEIYDWLIRNAQEKKNQSGKGFDTHFFGSESKNDKNGKPQQSQGGARNSPFFQPGQQEFDVARAIRDAANFAKQQGKLPAGIERMFGDILDPILDWKDILRKFIVQVIRARGSEPTVIRLVGGCSIRTKLFMHYKFVLTRQQVNQDFQVRPLKLVESH